MRILIAIDFSECSLNAFEEILDRSWPAGTQFRLLTVAEPIYTDYAIAGAYVQPMVDAHKEFIANCEKLVAEKVAELKHIFPKDEVVGVVAEGMPAETIIDEAKRWSADLIVLGSHGRKGLSRFLLGSVAEKVAGHAPCSVSVVKGSRQVDQAVPA